VSETGVPADWTNVKSIWLSRTVGILVDLLALDCDDDSTDEDDSMDTGNQSSKNDFNFDQELADAQQRMQDVEMN
jgi:hypothetical protein